MIAVLKVFKQAKRLMILAVGSTVLLVGLIMIVLPGPAILVVPLGLGILATEFDWARDLLTKAKEKFRRKPNTKEMRSRDQTKR